MHQVINQNPEVKRQNPEVKRQNPEVKRQNPEVKSRLFTLGPSLGNGVERS
jgi:hypothetical protein